jgi:hypothetical protein
MDNNNLNPSDPDYLIEDFWLGFKISMTNFYNLVSKDYQFITEWSKNLNFLKSEKRYSDIEFNIRNYISHYSFDLIKFSNSIYYDEILITNIKRWNKISIQFNFDYSNEHSKVLLVFLINLELKKDPSNNPDFICLYNFINFFDSIDSIITNTNFDYFIIYAFNNEKAKILEYLKNIPGYNLFDNIIRIYPFMNIKNINNTKFNKLCLFFRKNNNI